MMLEEERREILALIMGAKYVGGTISGDWVSISKFALFMNVDTDMIRLLWRLISNRIDTNYLCIEIALT